MSQSVGAPPRLFMVTVGHSVTVRIGTRMAPKFSGNARRVDNGKLPLKFLNLSLFFERSFVQQGTIRKPQLHHLR